MAELDETLPALELVQIGDVSPGGHGFLWLVRRRYHVRYPEGRTSAEFTYDAVDRRSRDAVVIVAHCCSAAGPSVYLRSALRPPLVLRTEGPSPVAETHGGNLWELPAGLIEPDEVQDLTGVRRAAARELREELGFHVDPEALQTLGPSVFPAPGMVAERQFFFSVEVEPQEQRVPDLDGSALEEGGKIVLVTLQRALEMCRAGLMPDSKTELGLRRFEESWGK